MRTLQQKELTRGESLMGATRPKHASWRTLKFKRRPRKLNKPAGTPPEAIHDDEHTQAEEIDRLLLSSLKYWEVERDLIEERMAAISH